MIKKELPFLEILSDSYTALEMLAIEQIYEFTLHAIPALFALFSYPTKNSKK